jgi:hypothetical protein
VQRAKSRPYNGARAMTRPLPLILALGSMAVVMQPSTVMALPTMIRLGYAGCKTCHYAPQGGGPLNPYGRTIDEAQSLRAGEYRPRANKVAKALSLGGRIAQDLRLVFPMQRAWAAHEDPTASFRARLMYRNFTELPRGFAAHFTMTGETDPAPRPQRAYDPNARSSSAIVNVALLRYHITPGLELAAGRDHLPSGVNIPDLGASFKARNRMGYYDLPTQVKMHWSGSRHQLIPFAYAPCGNEAAGERESGGGTLAEFDAFGNHRSVVGLSFLRGSAPAGNRQIVGAYTRLGFGSWGILAEHDVTDRSRKEMPGSFRQHATYGQIFWAAREWLVTSAIGERLYVQRPFEERLNAGAIEITARLTSVATIGASARVQRNSLTRRVAKSVTFQVALKTVY